MSAYHLAPAIAMILLSEIFIAASLGQDWKIEGFRTDASSVDSGSAITVDLNLVYSGSESVDRTPRIAIVLSPTGVLSAGDLVLHVFPGRRRTIVRNQPIAFRTGIVIPGTTSSGDYLLEAVIDSGNMAASKTPLQVSAILTPDSGSATPGAGTPGSGTTDDLFADVGGSGGGTGSDLGVQTPNTFGDSPNSGLQGLAFQSGTGAISGDYSSDIPLAGGLRRAKVAENNKALPMDRLFVLYNHFHNAFSRTETVLDPMTLDNVIERRAEHVDRYTLGFEKTFGDGLWSLECRVPFAADQSIEFDDGSFVNATDSGQMGNLAAFLKVLLYRDPVHSYVAGLGIDTPTGSDARLARTMIDPGFDMLQSEYIVKNESVHLMPYLGFMYTPNPCCYVHGFGQLDIATSGNSVLDRSGDGPGERDRFNFRGKLTDVDLIHFDIAMGRWLYRNPCACGECARGLTGLAFQVEFHLTAPLDEGEDTVLLDPMDPSTRFQSLEVDTAHVTIGIHTEFSADTEVRFGFVVPVGGDEPFDSELQMQINRRFGPRFSRAAPRRYIPPTIYALPPAYPTPILPPTPTFSTASTN